MNTLRPTLKKQLLGAALGMVGALVMYQAYGFVSPMLTAFLPESTVASEKQFTDDDRVHKQDEVVMRAREILQRISPEDGAGDIPYAGE